jgi:hypothetical protein
MLLMLLITSSCPTARSDKVFYLLACRLTITGTGFSTDRYAASNMVFIGPYPCNVLVTQTTDTMVRTTTRCFAACQNRPGISGRPSRRSCSCNPLLPSSQIVCETTPAAAGNYSVSVRVNNTLSATMCCFQYSAASTPCTLRRQALA